MEITIGDRKFVSEWVGPRLRIRIFAYEQEVGDVLYASPADAYHNNGTASQGVYPLNRGSAARFALLTYATEARKKLDEWQDSLGGVSCGIGYDESGEMLDMPPSPESTRDHILYLQQEWDTAERRIALLKEALRKPVVDSHGEDGNL